MKICPKCKKENLDSSAVCKNCGEVLPITSEWAATLKKNAKTETSQQAEKKQQAQPLKEVPPPVVWSPCMSAAGVFLVLSSFLVDPVNTGMVMAFGGALSLAALVRAIGEKKDGAGLCAILALIVCLFSAFIGLVALSK